jgi:LPXTG-site transpeptidase (sortase) family protein
MEITASVHLKYKILAAVVIVLATANALLWHTVFFDGMSVPAVRAAVVTPARAVSSHVAVPAPQPIVGEPVRITINSIALDAAVEKVALTADGSMDVPKIPADTGWYSLGPRPGEIGSATIAGHVNWYHGATAAFAYLHKVKPGDLITVQDDNGAVISFAVRDSKTLDAGADATDVFTSNDGNAHLNLITCDGTWDTSAKQYSKRLVVFADKVPE